MARGKKKKKKKSLPQLNIEKPNIPEESRISLVSDDTPLFCFTYFDHEILKKNKQHNTDLCFCFLERLQKLSNLGWKAIMTSDRHGLGTEKIPIKQIKCSLPSIITPDVQHLLVFRAKGLLPFLGLRDKNIFHVLYIEPNFGVVYDHE